MGWRGESSCRSAATGARERSDEQLLIDARADPESFGVFFDRFYEDVLRYFASRVRSPDSVADLSAETFASALAGLHRFDVAKGAARQWLYGIARHQLSRYWRDLRVAREARDRLRITDIPADDDTVRAVARAEAEADSTTLFAALGRLPPDQATAVRLRVIDELGYPEIAAMLGCKEGAIRVRVHRGLRRLEVEFG